MSRRSAADDFGDGSNPGSPLGNPAAPTYALPTLLTSPPPNLGEPAQTAASQYDYGSGLLTGFKDRNGFITQTLYNAPFDRSTLIKAALGPGLENHTALPRALVTGGLLQKPLAL